MTLGGSRTIAGRRHTARTVTWKQCRAWRWANRQGTVRYIDGNGRSCSRQSRLTWLRWQHAENGYFAGGDGYIYFSINYKLYRTPLK